MLTWFIVAIVTFHNGDTTVEQMQKPFATKELCQQFYLDVPGVKNDVLKMFPNQRGHTLLCLTIEDIKEITVPEEGTQV